MLEAAVSEEVEAAEHWGFSNTLWTINHKYS